MTPAPRPSMTDSAVAHAAVAKTAFAKTAFAKTAFARIAFAEVAGATLLGVLVLLTAASPMLAAPNEDGLVLEPREFPGPVTPLLPDPDLFPVQLVLDDDSGEAVFGFLGSTARQFLWLNSFASPGDFRLEEIWVLFPNGPDVPVGGDIQLAVFTDPDGDPTNGATLIGTYDDVAVQAADGSTFSVYPLDPPLDLADGSDVLIGVVNRFFMTGVDPPPTEPAAVDTNNSQGRSYFALWSGDPPAVPDLSGATVIDVLEGPNAGNFMIRGFGTGQPVINVPTLGGWGLALLVAFLGLAGLRAVARQRRA